MGKFVGVVLGEGGVMFLGFVGAGLRFCTVTTLE